MSEKLKTRMELMAELEKDAEVIRKHLGYTGVKIKIYENLNQMTLRIHIDQGGGIFGSAFKYRPDPVAPADGRAVIVGSLGKIRVSRGTFSKYGALQTYEDDESIYSGDAGWEDWCDYHDRDHHSPGWKKEWEPKE